MRPKILIVDDDHSIRDVLSKVCQTLNCDTMQAENGRRALELIAANQFTIVISDVRMPKMDGVSLLDEIERQGIDLPVIIMSGYSDYHAADIDARNGVVLLEKPFSRAQLKEIIEGFVALLPTRH